MRKEPAVSSLFLLTGTTFTMFWYSLTAACIALVEWPASAPTVHIGGEGRFARVGSLLRKLDFGHAFAWEQGRDSDLQLVSGERRFIIRGRSLRDRARSGAPSVYPQSQRGSARS